MKSFKMIGVWFVALGAFVPGCSSPSWTLEPDAGETRTGLVALASGQNNPGAIVSDGANVYWVNQGSPPEYADGAVMKVSVMGGRTTTLASGQSLPSAIAVDATSVYWVAGGPADGAVRKVALGGGTITILASGQAQPTGIAVDATSVYWTNQYDAVYGGDATCKNASGKNADLGGIALGGTVMKVPLAGGPATMLANEQCSPAGIAVNAAGVYWTNTDDCGSFITAVMPVCPNDPPGTVGNPDLENPGNTVMSVPLGGGAPTTLASNQNGPWPIAVNASNVYWTSPDNLSLLSVPIAGGTPSPLVSGQYYPWDVAVDATTAYWVNLDDSHSNGSVMSVPLDGSAPPVTIAAGQSASHLAVDGAGVYWTNQGKSAREGTVMKLTPK
jgi:hypothetical protein